MAGFTFEKGDIIGGRFEILGALGRGGFGEVYLAYRREWKEVCALKTIRNDYLADARSIEVFKNEALLWMNLDEHPFILAARYVDEFSGRLFVQMDYIAPDAQGRVSLADHLAHSHGPLDTNRALEWAIQFCHGMEHARRHGIKCHQDIKPTNILITQDGTLKISDFGLAVAVEAVCRQKGGFFVTGGGGGALGLSLVQGGGKGICGTPGYIAPELIRGKAPDMHSDIYSLGLVLWQLATGSLTPPFHVPYRGDIEEYLRGVFEQQIRGHVPTVGEPMQTVIECCLAPEPLHRYGSFEVLRGELELLFYRRTGQTAAVPEAGERTAAFWNCKGASLYALGRCEEAIACFSKALEIDPPNVNAWSGKGAALNRLGRHQEAIACFSKALEIDPQNAGAWNNKGMALDELGRPEEAIACYARASTIDPRNAFVWTNKGTALNRLGHHQEATACHAKALEIDPRFAGAWFHTANALLHLGRREEAIATYSKGLEINPHDAAAWCNIGTALNGLGRCEEAIACFSKALEIDPHDALTWFKKALAQESLGDKQSAAASLRKFLGIARHIPSYSHLTPEAETRLRKLEQTH
jgi:tetratricopeptide (TPR) repeat protein